MPENRFNYVKAPGVLDVTKLQADGRYPGDERLHRGPVAVFECMQEIACNPCEEACRKGHVRIGEDITRLPEISEACDGCGLCLPACPGLCIFILDASYSETEATVTMPYELLPLPAEGERVDALGRSGEGLCEGTVLRVRKARKGELCNAVTLVIPKQFIHEIRHLRGRPR